MLGRILRSRGPCIRSTSSGSPSPAGSTASKASSSSISRPRTAPSASSSATGASASPMRSAVASQSRAKPSDASCSATTPASSRLTLSCAGIATSSPRSTTAAPSVHLAARRPPVKFRRSLCAWREKTPAGATHVSAKRSATSAITSAARPSPRFSKPMDSTRRQYVPSAPRGRPSSVRTGRPWPPATSLRSRLWMVTEKRAYSVTSEFASSKLSRPMPGRLALTGMSANTRESLGAVKGRRRRRAQRACP
ncbi:hypothetical protein Hoch_0801 [Haliangium ochraceum DSM 14365]|uniref:Uncharacterized protein n=1 Tax=Haliangium ochraceum (strain DSM 14365 / JCM 11303 / SMP-2) TaxID=502025 RepID=D0LN46_HALO1|nr:hypothetical protein Hoch_0801 [Haliangium ochraceum DSM 14365]